MCVHGVFLCLFSCVYWSRNPEGEKWEGSHLFYIVIYIVLPCIGGREMYINDLVLIIFSSYALMNYFCLYYFFL